MEARVSFASYRIYKVWVRFRDKEIWKERLLLIRNKWNDVLEIKQHVNISIECFTRNALTYIPKYDSINKVI